MGVLYRTPLFMLHLKRKINMAFSLYDALDKSKGFIKSFDCKLPLGNNTTIIVIVTGIGHNDFTYIKVI